MNLLIWNCPGGLNPNFCEIVNKLVRLHSPAIMIVVETKFSFERAKRISKKLDYDRAIFANSIGLTGGLWVLWDSGQMEISKLSSTEQEIHTIISSLANPPWLLSTFYASPHFAERCLL